MKQVFLGLGLLILALWIGIIADISLVGAAGPNVCPDDEIDVSESEEGWYKVDGLSGYSYTFDVPDGYEVVANCYKHATYRHIDEDGGPTVVADFHNDIRHALSHASFKLELVEAVEDVCENNIEGDQESLPDGHYFSDKGVCSEIVYGCLDEIANNYNEQATHSDESCTYDEAPYCYEGETILVSDNERAPKGAEVGVCETDDAPEEPVKTVKEVVLFTAPQPASAPVCDAVAPTKEPANPHIYRNGDEAIVKWHPTDGSQAHLYYKINGADSWQHSVRDIDNTGYYVISGLGSRDWDFAVQQAQDCAAGPISPVIEDGVGEWVLFTPTIGLYVR